MLLKFTPLEFETIADGKIEFRLYVKIYSVGVWNTLFDIF